jgi:YHS domain-containing protein
MDVDPAKARGESEYEGKRYYFCSPRCREEFEREPSRYAGGSRSGGCPS